jgi:ADP-ribose pyrophosphatase
MAYELIATSIGFEGKIFEVRVDQLKLPGGQQMRYDYVVHQGAVAVVPIDAQDRVWFVEQYRHAVRTQLLEIPAGTLEGEEPPEECAARECREEIGMAPGQLEQIAGFHLAPGYSSEYIHLYLATDLHSDPLPRDQDEVLETRPIELEQVRRMYLQGEFKDAKTIAAIGIVLSRLGI